MFLVCYAVEPDTVLKAGRMAERPVPTAVRHADRG